MMGFPSHPAVSPPGPVGPIGPIGPPGIFGEFPVVYAAAQVPYRVYRQNDVGEVVLASAATEADIDEVRGISQGTANRVGSAHGSGLWLDLVPGLVLDLTPDYKMPVFLSTVPGGFGTTEDPQIPAVLGTYSLLLGTIDDPTTYGTLGRVFIQYEKNRPVGPLSPAVPPIPTQTYNCAMTDNVGDLVAVGAADNQVEKADAGYPNKYAFAKIIEKPTATTCVVEVPTGKQYPMPYPEGTELWLPVGGGIPVNTPPPGSPTGQIAQRVGFVDPDGDWFAELQTVTAAQAIFSS